MCVSGSRKFGRLDLVRTWAATLAGLNVVLLHGGAVGVDAAAAEEASRLGVATELWPFMVELGAAGGPIRNRMMMATCDAAIFFWDGYSNGTHGAWKAALEFGKPVLDVIVVLGEPKAPKRRRRRHRH